MDVSKVTGMELYHLSNWKYQIRYKLFRRNHIQFGKNSIFKKMNTKPSSTVSCDHETLVLDILIAEG